MIVVTGAAGFIGSNLVHYLNHNGFNDLVLVDDFSIQKKQRNITNTRYTLKIHRDDFFEWLVKEQRFVEFVFHIGARTDTSEFDPAVFDKLNLKYSKSVWQICSEYGIPLVYASSAATYGAGEYGYDDNHDIIPKLKPLNPYGISKNEFDKWVLQQQQQPGFWAGLKFFNVYGPNEYHKGRMASVIFHAFHQIKETGRLKLFRSHKAGIADGEQSRDFIYVKDITKILIHLMLNRSHSGIFNAGTGKARTFIDLAKNVFTAMKKEPVIDFIDTPADIRNKYQYFTEASMQKLREVGYSQPFYSLDDGIAEYVSQYLMNGSYQQSQLV